MRKRLVTILAFPVITGIFLIGWLLYCVGCNQESPDKTTPKKSTALEKQAELTADEEIELELVEEKPAKQYAAQ